MKTTRTELFFRTDRNGKVRAYRVSRMQMRSFPIAYDLAVALIATGEAIDIGRPFWATDPRSW